MSVWSVLGENPRETYQRCVPVHAPDGAQIWGAFLRRDGPERVVGHYMGREVRAIPPEPFAADPFVPLLTWPNDTVRNTYRAIPPERLIFHYDVNFETPVLRDGQVYIAVFLDHTRYVRVPIPDTFGGIPVVRLRGEAVPL